MSIAYMTIEIPHRLVQLASARYRQHPTEVRGTCNQTVQQTATLSQLQNHSLTYILLSELPAYRTKTLVNMHVNCAQPDVGTG